MKIQKLFSGKVIDTSGFLKHLLYRKPSITEVMEFDELLKDFAKDKSGRTIT